MFLLSSRSLLLQGESRVVKLVTRVGNGLWVNFNEECVLFLYHLASLERLQEVNLSRAVRDFVQGTRCVYYSTSFGLERDFHFDVQKAVGLLRWRSAESAGRFVFINFRRHARHAFVYVVALRLFFAHSWVSCSVPGLDPPGQISEQCHVASLWNGHSKLFVGMSNGLLLVMPLPKLAGSVPKITGWFCANCFPQLHQCQYVSKRS